ncbi:MAG: AAA family ATPase [Oscillospiraceae bacterium]|nr:AAA family ATPase [Oscillospiraceae bacterium]
MTRIIALVNQKGGVGKTTSTINLGAGLAAAGKRVLLADLDPQANLSTSLGIDAYGSGKTIYEALRGLIPAQDALWPCHNYRVIPASIELSGAEIELSTAAGREFLLKEALEGLAAEYDYVLLDCAPSLGLLTLGALTLANEVFIPLQSEFLALQGVSKLMQTIQVVQKRLNPSLHISGIIGTLYDARKKLNREVIVKIGEYFDDKLFRTLIRDNISLAEAPSYGLDIFAYKPDSYGAQDYAALTQEVLAQEVKHA